MLGLHKAVLMQKGHIGSAEDWEEELYIKSAEDWEEFLVRPKAVLRHKGVI